MNDQQTSPQSWLSNLRIVVGSSTPLLYDNGNQQVPIVLIVAPAPGQEVSREQLDSLTLAELTQDGYKALATEPNAQGWRYSLERDLRFDYYPHGLDPVGEDADWAKAHSGEISKTVYVHADAPVNHALRLVAKIHRDKDTEYYSDHDAYRSSVIVFASAAPEYRYPQDYKWERIDANGSGVNGSFMHEYLLEANFRKFVAVTLPDPASKLLVHEYSGQASGKLTTQIGLADSFNSSDLNLHQPDNARGIVVRLQSDGQLAGGAALANDEAPFTFTALDNYGNVHQISLSLKPDQPNPLSVTAIAGINDHSLEAWLSRFTIEAGADGDQVDNDGEQHIAIKVIVEPAAGQQITDEQFNSLGLYEVKPDGVYRPLPASPKAEGWRYSRAIEVKPTGDALLAGATRCKEFYIHTKAPTDSCIELVASIHRNNKSTPHFSDHSDYGTRLSVFAKRALTPSANNNEPCQQDWLSQLSIHVASPSEQLYNNANQQVLIKLIAEPRQGQALTSEQLNSLSIVELTADGTYAPLLEDREAAWHYSVTRDNRFDYYCGALEALEKTYLHKRDAYSTAIWKEFYIHTQATAGSTIDLVAKITKDGSSYYSLSDTFDSMVTLTAQAVPEFTYPQDYTWTKITECDSAQTGNSDQHYMLTANSVDFVEAGLIDENQQSTIPKESNPGQKTSTSKIGISLTTDPHWHNPGARTQGEDLSSDVAETNSSAKPVGVVITLKGSKHTDEQSVLQGSCSFQALDRNGNWHCLSIDSKAEHRPIISSRARNSAALADSDIDEIVFFQLRGMDSSVDEATCPVYANNRHQTKIVIVVGAQNAAGEPVVPTEALLKRIELIDYSTGAILSKTDYPRSFNKDVYEPIYGSKHSRETFGDSSNNSIELWVSTAKIAMKRVAAKLTYANNRTFFSNDSSIPAGGTAKNGRSNSSVNIMGLQPYAPYPPDTFIVQHANFPVNVPGNHNAEIYRIHLPTNYGIRKSINLTNQANTLHVCRRKYDSDWSRFQTAWNYGQFQVRYNWKHSDTWTVNIKPLVRGQAIAFRFAAYYWYSTFGDSAQMAYYDSNGIIHNAWIQHFDNALWLRMANKK